jgi:hypothetical protein
MFFQPHTGAVLMKGKPLASFGNQVAKPVTAAGNERTVALGPCLACGRMVTGGYYGRFGNEGVCSKKCNEVQAMKTKYPNILKEGTESQAA